MTVAVPNLLMSLSPRGRLEAGRREDAEMGKREPETAERSIAVFLNALIKLAPGGAFLILAGLTPLIIFGLSDRSRFLLIVGVGSMVAAGAFVVGGFTGFLFGIPRTAQAEEPAPDGTTQRRIGYRVNTNLEQISDWLTKILVGVGLIQLPQIADAGRRLATLVAAAMGAGPGSLGMAAGLLVYFLGNGFLGGYYLTRTTLTTVFAVSDTQVQDIEDRVRRAEEVSREALLRSEQLARDIGDPPDLRR
ncbi:hypothetical protein [Actinoplanes sp. NPDC048796]|uniref:hypothetical protein n=1 Tax=Actinoplanes sp. NPDC048796 TaxID=3155640 RepID=UPI0034015386